MARMRGVDPFEFLWERRTIFQMEGDEEYDVLSVPDLIRAKKTQRTKDWPMIERLVLENYFTNRRQPTQQHIIFWLSEARTPTVLQTVATRFSEVRIEREAAVLAREGGREIEIEAALKREEERERELDRAYWAPLKAELEELRRARRSGS